MENSTYYLVAETIDTQTYYYLPKVDGGYDKVTVPAVAGYGTSYRSFLGMSPYRYRAILPAGTTYYYGTVSNGSFTQTGSGTVGSDGYTDWVPYSPYTYITTTAGGDNMTKRGYLYIFSGGLEFEYTRDTANLTYLYGTFRTHKEQKVENPPFASGVQIKQIKDILYEKPLDNYAVSGADYYIPEAPEGYAFTGWFANPECTEPYDFTGKKMALNGVTVYAQFTQIGYRVFLNANVDTVENGYEWPTDSSDNPIVTWASSGQQKNFKIGWNELVNNGEEVKGSRNGYALVGWYLDPECTKPFNFNVSLTEQNVPELDDEEYDKAVDFTDKDSETGVLSNSDADRLYVTKKLNLYAKWRKVLEGASGIHVMYDADNAHVDNHDPKYHGSFGEDGDGAAVTTWLDGTLYTDGARVIARSASIPGNENYQFLYWEILDSLGNPTGEIVYPGQDFVLDFDYVDVTTAEGSAHTHNITKIAEKAPNCGYEGNKEYYQCTSCGMCFSDAAGTQKISKATTVLPVTGNHVADTTWRKNAANHYQKCTVCGKSVNQAAHDENDIRITDPTATSDGIKSVYCSVCGYHIRDEVFNKYAVSFVVPNGFTAPTTQYVDVGSAADMTVTPTGSVPGYTFYGWSPTEVDETKDQPEKVTSYTPEGSVTFYAVFSYTGSETVYQLKTSLENGGKYILVDQNAISGTTGYAVGN
ncbi:MAG: InlB B-repeat-containing protein, partial [Bacteroidales bacterium]|nr:InlB B-repeat-containing protein [Bacteroidales bacterium]